MGLGIPLGIPTPWLVGEIKLMGWQITYIVLYYINTHQVKSISKREAEKYMPLYSVFSTRSFRAGSTREVLPRFVVERICIVSFLKPCSYSSFGGF